MATAVLNRSLMNQNIVVPAEAMYWRWRPEDLKNFMDTLGVTEEDISGDLWIPLSRVRSALRSGKSESPHVESTRTLIGIYLRSGIWEGRNEASR